jgi:RNA 3'-terminal phosphate cyclase (ATP)
LADLRVIDGSHGEGGGQILRTALSLSIVARGFSLEYIRANRCNPGLRPQHLAAVRAAATVSGAAVSGDALGSAELTFAPGHTGRGGDYVFDVAAKAERGSATLILQTLFFRLRFPRAPPRCWRAGERMSTCRRPSTILPIPTCRRCVR